MKALSEKEPDIVNEIWKDDRLGRKADAIHLISYLENAYKDKKRLNQAYTSENHEGDTGNNLVLNINAEWGFGKSFFLKHLKQHLEKNHVVAMFDAWKTDFSNDPLLSFIAEITKQIEDRVSNKCSESNASKSLKSVKEHSKKLGIAMMPVLAEIIAKKLTGLTSEELSELLESDEDNQDDESDLANDIGKLTKVAATTALKQYNDKKENIDHFRIAFKKLVRDINAETGKHLPVFILVDELDRCRPNYAIEVLENIKHLFNIEDVYFVVATDSQQLGHAVTAIYGSGFNAEKYLKRFFDIEYQFSTPNYYEFAEYLFSTTTINNEDLFIPNGVENIPKAFSDISSYFQLPLRQQIKCFEIMKACCYTKQENVRLHIYFLLFLASLKQIIPTKKYEEIIHKKHGKSFTVINKELRSQNSVPNEITYETYETIMNNRVQPCTIPISVIFDYYWEFIDDPKLQEKSRFAITDSIRSELALSYRESKLQLKDYIDLVNNAGKITT